MKGTLLFLYSASLFHIIFITVIFMHQWAKEDAFILFKA